MKRMSFTMDVSKYRRLGTTLGILGKTYMVLAACTMLVFLLIGAVSYGQSKLNTSPVSSMKGLAAAVSNDFFLDMMGLEVPHLSEQKDAASVFSQKNVVSFLFRMVTDINPRDPKTLLAREVPGLGLESSYLIRKPSGGEVGLGPVDYPPADAEPKPGLNPQPDVGPEQQPPVVAPSMEPTTEPKPVQQPGNKDLKKAVLIYHSHPRESWVPELGLTNKEANKANDAEKNITLVGKELAERLEEKGVGALHYGTDYATTVENYNWYFSYKYSNKTVKEAFAANPDIKFIFDLHRDASSKEMSTLTVDGKKYAKVFFIIGQKNPNWEKNESFAAEVQDKLEEKMPGISRGIWAKKAHDGNAEYNQSLSTNSILIEVGGVYNTLEECKRTAALLADVIAELYWDAEKVDAPAVPVKQGSET